MPSTGVPRRDRLAQPLGGALAPRLAVGDHRRRAGHHHRRARVARLGQRLALVHAAHAHLVSGSPMRGRDPALEVAGAAAATSGTVVPVFTISTGSHAPMAYAQRGGAAATRRAAVVQRRRERRRSRPARTTCSARRSACACSAAGASAASARPRSRASTTAWPACRGWRARAAARSARAPRPRRAAAYCAAGALPRAADRRRSGLLLAGRCCRAAERTRRARRSCALGPLESSTARCSRCGAAARRGCCAPGSAGAPLALCALALYYLERVEGVRSLRPLFALLLVLGFWLRALR